MIVRENVKYLLVCEGDNFNGHYDGTRITFTYTGAFKYSVKKLPTPVKLETIFDFEKVEKVETRKRKTPEVPEVPEVPVPVPEKRVREPFVFIPTFF
jgi:hypothetical protein